MQPYVLPYIGYFQLINAVDTFVFLDDVTYINKGWINRNFTQNKGVKNLFTIPLVNASQNELIKNIQVLKDDKWKRKFFTSIEHAYKKCPYYDERILLLNEIFDFDEISIGDLAKKSILSIVKELNLKTKIVDSSSVFDNQDLKGESRIINIVEQTKGTHYINPIGGQELYNKESFLEKNILLNFINSGSISYKQPGDVFIPNLSIIDVLMNNNNENIQVFLNEYTLI